MLAAIYKFTRHTDTAGTKERKLVCCLEGQLVDDRKTAERHIYALNTQ